MQFASKIGVEEVLFEGDLMIVIQALTHSAASEAPYGNPINDILFLLLIYQKLIFVMLNTLVIG